MSSAKHHDLGATDGGLQEPPRSLGSLPEGTVVSNKDNGNTQLSLPKRIACVLCRKRKLKCNGNKPSCGACTRLQHECFYYGARKKSGPKKGYVKALEARLAQVEPLLTQDQQTALPPPTGTADFAASLHHYSMPFEFTEMGLDPALQGISPSYPEPTLNSQPQPDELDNFSWEMISLGLDEPLPNQDVVDELNQLYFDKIHPTNPMLNRARYFGAMHFAPHQRPPLALRYAMWAFAAGVSDRYAELAEPFYQRSRRYLQQDEMKGVGEAMVTLQHCQTWVLLAGYEFKAMYFPRAWMSSGRASRMALMMDLHRVDSSGMKIKQSLGPPRDATEREERRRTFWQAFCIDRYAGIGSGWPTTLNGADVVTCLPSDEASYQRGDPVASMSLADALEPAAAAKLSPFAGVVVMTAIFGRYLAHVSRPQKNEGNEGGDVNDEYWKRHRHLDSILCNTTRSLPDSLRLPAGLNDPNVVYMNMSIHTSTIFLHQAAVTKAEQDRLPARVANEGRMRCLAAAGEIANIMRQIAHHDSASIHCYAAFCLYVACRVYVQALKFGAKDSSIRPSLQFLLSAMQAIKRKNPLTESFLIQLDLDLAGMEDSQTLRAQAFAGAFPASQHSSARPFAGGPPSGSLGDCRSTRRADAAPCSAEASGLHDPPDGSQVAARLPIRLSQRVAAHYVFGSSQANSDRANRNQLPGAQLSCGPRFNPHNFHADMDTSPRDSAGGTHLTPNLSLRSHCNHLSHNSVTAYPPSTMQPLDVSSHITLPPASISLPPPHRDPAPLHSNNFSMPKSGPVDHRFPPAWEPAFDSRPPAPTTGFLAAGSTSFAPQTEATDGLVHLTDDEWSRWLEPWPAPYLDANVGPAPGFGDSTERVNPYG